MTGRERFLSYAQAARDHDVVAASWGAFVRSALVGRWLEEYARRTSWEPGVLEIQQARLTYLFDASPTTADLAGADDRLVAVWGESQPAVSRRDSRRQAGFLRDPTTWSGMGRDRGHFVAHAAGGG